MTFFWPAEDAGAAVRSRLQRVDWESRVVAYRPVDVATDDKALVCHSATAGSARCSPRTLDEELNTGMVQTAERTVTSDGLVMLRWRSPSGVR
jgi:hypothetical protein